MVKNKIQVNVCIHQCKRPYSGHKLNLLKRNRQPWNLRGIFFMLSFDGGLTKEIFSLCVNHFFELSSLYGHIAGGSCLIESWSDYKIYRRSISRFTERDTNCLNISCPDRRVNVISDIEDRYHRRVLLAIYRIYIHAYIYIYIHEVHMWFSLVSADLGSYIHISQNVFCLSKRRIANLHDAPKNWRSLLLSQNECKCTTSLAHTD